MDKSQKFFNLVNSISFEKEGGAQQDPFAAIVNVLHRYGDHSLHIIEQGAQGRPIAQVYNHGSLAFANHRPAPSNYDCNCQPRCPHPLALKQVAVIFIL
jgi:hypothetical protein